LKKLLRSRVNETNRRQDYGNITAGLFCKPKTNFIKFAISDHFKETYWIPGNHEYYQNDISNRSGSFEEKIINNMSLVNNVVKNFGAHQLLFSTQWSSISLLNGWRIERGLNDFYQIRYNGKRFQIPDYNEFHAKSLTFLRDALDTIGKKGVVTHHAPTFKYYPPEYISDYLNEAFAMVLDDLI